jgi:hypothetical protein
LAVVTETSLGEIGIETIDVIRSGAEYTEGTGVSQVKADLGVVRSPAGCARDDTAAVAQQVAIERLARSDGGKRKVFPHHDA